MVAGSSCQVTGSYARRLAKMSSRVAVPQRDGCERQGLTGDLGRGWERERCSESLRLFRRRGAVAALDNVDDVSGMLGSDGCLGAASYELRELHDVFENVRFGDLLVRTGDVWEDPHLRFP